MFSDQAKLHKKSHSFDILERADKNEGARNKAFCQNGWGGGFHLSHHASKADLKSRNKELIE